MFEVWSCKRTLIKCFFLAALLTFFVGFFLNRRGHAKAGQSLHPVDKEFYAVISPSTYKYVLNQPEKCKGRHPFLVLMVPVAPKDRSSRDAVRKTWGQEDSIPNVDILRLFFAGLPPGDWGGVHIQSDLEKESQEHRDIIQMDFLDSYGNLTVKTMMMMHWLASQCGHASYAMKVDADIFLNVHYLVQHLLDPTAGTARRGFITGSVIADGRPRRNRNSKWHIPEEVFPEDSYPPYVSGAGYVFSTDLAGKISWASRFVRPLPLEDVYVGLCLRLLGVRPVYSYSLASMRSLFVVGNLEYRRCAYSQLVLVNGFPPHRLLRVWHDFQKAPFTC
ncbi:beta-1,3-galactosyltransferase 2 [Megalops cyprinoides]|uniref:beta-1,3-galactosyltransferase 2 n=1 Tax=Megalops cyprinoides TaxID=118141 RepID=UPI00186453B3|nr:beta-1,3-galactosyltransferase 2 [Megalops cyprinoides]